MYYNFQTVTHGKWILAGEHSVIRGGGALVFPIHEKKLTLRFHSSTTKLSADYEGESGADMHLLFWSVLEQGMQLLGQSLNSLSGYFHLSSNIPLGVGMGASAALCVAVARWFLAQSMLKSLEVQQFAQELEHLFHGKSSGVDIAGASSDDGVYFEHGHYSVIKQAWKPQWYLSSCGQIGITSHCIQQVQSVWCDNEINAKRIDESMKNSVLLARQALTIDAPESKKLLANAMNLARECFKHWGLVSENLERHMNMLQEAGALAVKPTGSGGGGYVISLWNHTPPPLQPTLIPV